MTALPTFTLAFGEDEAAVSRGWEADFRGECVLQVTEDRLALSAFPFGWMVVGNDGYLGRQGRALTREQAERAVVAAATWG